MPLDAAAIGTVSHVSELLSNYLNFINPSQKHPKSDTFSPFPMRRSLILIPLLAFCVGIANAQTRSLEPSADSLLQDYATATHSQAPALANYTFQILHTDTTYVENKRTAKSSYVAEQIYIAGQPYIRRLAQNGKPLAGKALQRESELYDQAVKERSGLTDPLRWKQAHLQTTSFTFIPDDQILQDHFVRTVTGRDVVDGHECWVLDLRPSAPNVPTNLQRHIRLWIDHAEHKLVRDWAEYLTDDASIHKGTNIATSYAYIQGDILPSGSRTELFAAEKIDSHTLDIHIVSTDQYSNFKRFRTTVTLSPAHEATPPK
jgi:hypothetical protein